MKIGSEVSEIIITRFSWQQQMEKQLEVLQQLGSSDGDDEDDEDDEDDFKLPTLASLTA